MYQRRYDKVYLMLRQETAGFGLGSRGPWGSCILEIKNGQGRLTVAVEGLRPLLHGQYKVYGLLAKDGECSGIFCGNLGVNKQGHGEIAWDFAPDDLGSGYCIEDLFGVTVVTETGSHLSAPLTAYVGEKRQWQALFAPLGEDTVLQAAETAVLERPAVGQKREESARVIELPQKEQKTETKAGNDEKPKKEDNMESAQQSTPIKTQEQPDFSYHGNFRGLLKKFRQEMAELEEMGVLTAEESARILGKKSVEAARSGKDCRDVPIELLKKEEQTELPQTEPEKTDIPKQQERVSWVEADEPAPEERQKEPVHQEAQKQEECQEKEKETQEPKTDVEWDFFADNRRMTPFGDGMPWICVSLKELLYFGEIPSQRQRDFFFLLSYHRYGHLILRQTEEGVLIGLPDSYDSSARRRAEGLGFTEFRPLPGQKDMGYWIGLLSR